MKIAFCTTCKGRAQHLERTLPKNFADNADFQDCVFIVLDYNSQDHLLEYLKTSHAAEIESGRLVVYSHNEPGPFRMAHAKNMAHRLGILENADVLVNLDADNFTGPGFAAWIARQYDRRKRHELFLFANAKSVCGRARQGLAGRIALSRNLFLKVGGYDERYKDWAPEDEDIKARIRRLGYEGRLIPTDYLYVIPHRDGLRFAEYPHAKPTAETEAAAKKAICEANTTIANYGNFGCGKAFKLWKGYELEGTLNPLPTRIFGIGMQKTATTSLNSALNILGYDSAHWTTPRWAKEIWQEMNQYCRSLTLERHYALSDLPIAILFEKLDRAYPGSKFILTTRHERGWLESVRKHWDREFNSFRDTWDDDAFSHRMHQITYGRKEFAAEIFLARYRRHNAEVKAYFKERPGDLLVMDMDRGAGWKELCGFLGDSVPDVPYPKTYVTPKNDQPLADPEAGKRDAAGERGGLGWPLKLPLESCPTCHGVLRDQALCLGCGGWGYVPQRSQIPEAATASTIQPKEKFNVSDQNRNEVLFNENQLATWEQARKFARILSQGPIVVGGGVMPETADQATSGFYVPDWNGGPGGFPEPHYTDPKTGHKLFFLHYRFHNGAHGMNVGLIMDKFRRYPNSPVYVMTNLAAEADSMAVK